MADFIDKDEEIRYLRRQLEERTREDESLVNNILARGERGGGQNDQFVDEVIQQSDQEVKKLHAKVKNLENEKTVLQDRVWELERKERTRERERGGNNEENRQLQIEIDRIKHEKRRVELTLEQAEKEKNDLKDRHQLAVRDLQEKIHKGNKDIDLLMKDKQTLNDDLKRERDSSQRRSQQMLDELDRRKNEIDTLNARIIEEQNKQQHQQRQRPQTDVILKGKLEEADDKIIKLNMTIGRMKDELNVAKNGWDQGERDRLMQKNQALERDLQIEKERVQKSHKKVEELSQRIHELERQKSEVQKSLHTTILQSPKAAHVEDELISDLRAQVKHLKEQLYEQPQEQQGPNDNFYQIESLKVDLAQLRQDCDRFEKERDDLKEQLRKGGERKGVDTTQRTFKEVYEQLKKDYEKLQQRNTTLNQENTTLQNEITQLSYKNTLLLKKTTSESRDFQKEQRELNEKIDKLVLQNNTLAEKNTQLKGQLEGLLPTSKDRDFNKPKKSVFFSDNIQQLGSSDNARPIPAPRRKRANSESLPAAEKPVTITHQELQAIKDEMSDMQAQFAQLKESNRQKESLLAARERRQQHYDDTIQERSLEDDC